MNSAAGVLKETDKELSSFWRDGRGLLADISWLFFIVYVQKQMTHDPACTIRMQKDRFFEDGFDSGK
jgi:hypothetical protein